MIKLLFICLKRIFKSFSGRNLIYFFMVYKKFNGIDIENSLGVCLVNSGGRDTEMIAYHTAELKLKSVLDIGTGTGFIPIYLASLGIKATGTDINPLAVELSQKNAARNKLSVNFFVSDLFSGLREREREL